MTVYQVPQFKLFGGIHGETAVIQKLLQFHGMQNPYTAEPLTETLCLGISGGITAGYHFCPSVVGHGVGSGVALAGRHRKYVTDHSWYQEAFDRLGVETVMTETAASKQAFKNLNQSLQQGLPTIVWSGRSSLACLGKPVDATDFFMHSLIIYALDEENQVAFGSDRSKKNSAIYSRRTCCSESQCLLP